MMPFFVFNRENGIQAGAQRNDGILMQFQNFVVSYGSNKREW